LATFYPAIGGVLSNDRKNRKVVPRPGANPSEKVRFFAFLKYTPLGYN
jgi:hypothetical protein